MYLPTHDTSSEERSFTMQLRWLQHGNAPEAAPKRVGDTIAAAIVRAPGLPHPYRKRGSGSRRLIRGQCLRHVGSENGDEIQVCGIKSALAGGRIEAASERVKVMRHDAGCVAAVQQLEELGVPVAVPRVSRHKRERRGLGVQRIRAADGVHETSEISRVLLGRKFGLNAKLTCELISKLQGVYVAVAPGKRVIQQLFEVVALPSACPRSIAAGGAIGRRAISAFGARRWLHSAMQRRNTEDNADIGELGEV